MLTIDDKEHLALQKDISKKSYPSKKTVCKSYLNSKNTNNIQYARKLRLLQEDLHSTSEVSELNYYSRITNKLTFMQKNTKVY